MKVGRIVLSEFANMPTTEFSVPKRDGAFYKLAKKIYTEIQEWREEILKAFIAKHNLQPDEVEQVFQSTPDGFRWWVRKRGES